MKNKKGELLSALQQLPVAILMFVVFALVLTVGFKILGALYTGESNAGIQSNISVLTQGLGQFSINSGLIATITVMAIVLSIVIGAFAVNRN